MAEHFDHNHPDSQPSEDLSSTPIEQEQMEVEQPRREASAEFVVESTPGSEAALRQAMDPANQSLAEALRLSYRVLQVVILGLIVAFLFSGFKTVESDSTGVRTVFGEITGDTTDEALSPGLKLGWPYPVGEFVLFQLKRPVELDVVFWPETRGRDFDEYVQSARVNNSLQPGRDGLLLTRDGDIAHMQLTAEYVVVDPVRYLRTLPNRNADEFVRNGLQRGAIHAVSSMSLTEFIEQREETIRLIKLEAQRVLDQVDSGIELTDVTIPRREPAGAIKNAYQDVNKARVDAQTTAEQVRQSASSTLINVAGSNYQQMIDLIDRYEDALDRDQPEKSEELLEQINQMLLSDQIAGEAKDIVARAQSYRSQVESTLGAEARRVASLQEAFKENPSLVVQQLWSKSYSKVIDAVDAELFSMPEQMGIVRLALESSQRIQRVRQQTESERRRQQSFQSDLMYTPNILDREALGEEGKPGRRLTREGESVDADRRP